MNKQDYLLEGLYETLEKDPTQEYNNQIHQVLQKAVNPNTIDDKTMKTLYNKSPRPLTFICYPRYINLTYQEDPL